MVAMNHKIKWHNCLEGNGKLGFLMISLKHAFMKSSLWSLYIFICKCYYHTLFAIWIASISFEFILFAQIYFIKDTMEENVSLLTSRLFKDPHCSKSTYNLVFFLFFLMFLCISRRKWKFGSHSPFMWSFFLDLLMLWLFWLDVWFVFSFGYKINLILLKPFTRKTLTWWSSIAQIYPSNIEKIKDIHF